MTVTPDQVAVTLGRSTTPAGTDPEWATWSQWIADAQLAIRIGLTQRGVEGGVNALDPDVVEYVVREAVALKVRNPDGSTQVDVAVDDARTSRRWTSATGQVTILPEWWDMLLAGRSGVKGKQEAYSIDTAPTSGIVHLPWCDLHFNKLSCSCGASIAGVPIYEGGLW